jgi:transmembrane sensor
MNIARNEKTEARRLVEAAAWRAHLTETDQDTTPAFEAWLVAEEGNRQAWHRVCHSWDFLGEQATSPELLDVRRRALADARSSGRQRWLADAFRGRFRRVRIAAGLGVLAIAGYLAVTLMGPDVYRTAAGERRVVTLSDGSQIQLDSLTELRVDYSERARDLELLRGQARFDVAHDVERPFSVLAAGQKVVATGTAFNVDLLGSNLFVTLIEGKVVILPQGDGAGSFTPVSAPVAEPGSADPVVPARARPQSIELTPGQQLAVAPTGAASVAPANVRRATAWQNGQLVFDNEPLSSVIVRVNRYATRPLSLSDEKAAALRISGVFNTGDVEGFVTTITHYLPIEARRVDDTILLSSNAEILE